MSVKVKYSRSSAKPLAQDLESFVVPALSTVERTLGSLRGDLNLRNSFFITAQAKPGDLLAKVWSTSKSELRRVETLGKDEKDPENGGTHPWSLESNTESTLLLFNHNEATQGFSVTISGENTTGHKVYKLEPMQTEQINIRDIVQRRVKDETGRTLPLSISNGQIRWFTQVSGVGKGRLLQSSRARAMARNFSCGTTYVLCAAQFGAGTTTFPVGSQSIEFGYVVGLVCMPQPPFYQRCAGQGAGPDDLNYQYSWATDNTSIAIASTWFDGLASHVRVNGQAAGTANVTGTIYDPANSCRFSAGATGTVQQASVSLNPTTVAPGAQTTVTVTLQPAMAGQQVSLSAAAVSNSGGHQHTSGRPVGSFSNGTGTTNSGGQFTTQYTASAFGGSETITGTINGSNGSQTLTVAVPALVQLFSGPNYTLVGPTSTHPVDHYGTANTNLVNIANQYANAFPGGVLNYNDQSLPQGGLFDVNANWTNPHVEHRLGINCDVYQPNVPVANRPTLLTIFVNNGSPNYLDESALNHWHLRFGAAGNPAGD